MSISSSTVHLYFARAAKNKSDNRFFVRALIRPGRLTHDVPMYLISECDRVMNDVLNVLEASFGRPEFSAADASHIFMSFLYPMPVALSEIRGRLQDFVERHVPRMTRLRVHELELRLVGPGAVVCLCMFAEYRSRCAVVAMVRGGERS